MQNDFLLLCVSQDQTDPVAGYSFRVPMLCAAIGQGESLVTMPEISGSHSVSRNPLVKQWIRRVNEACLRKCQQNGAPIPSGPREKADDLM